jgi:hypothetical protein
VTLKEPEDAKAGVQIKLEKQSFGTMKVKVVDEKGEALIGATVQPRGNPRNMQEQVYINGRIGGVADYAPVSTDEKGEARLQGLGAGNRTFEVELPGYYLAAPFKATVVGDQEQTATATLKTGLTINGKLELPEGANPANMLISVSGLDHHRANANGEFSIGGLKPGRYTLSVNAPGFVTAAKTTEVILVDGVQPAPLKVWMVRNAGLAVNVGAEHVGLSATLIQYEDIANNKYDYGAGATVDGTGRIEFFGFRPGKYHIMLTPRVEYMVGTPRSQRIVRAPYVGGPVEAASVNSYADVAKLKAVDVSLKTGTASVVARLAPDRVPSSNMGFMSHGTIRLRLLGPANANIVFNYPSDFMYNDYQRTLILNAPDVATPANETGAFSISNLVPGDYKIEAVLNMYNYNRSTLSYDVNDDEKEKPAVIAKFSLKEGEKVDLGELKYEMGKLPVFADQDKEPEPDDQPPGFQP